MTHILEEQTSRRQFSEFLKHNKNDDIGLLMDFKKN
jgi:hypothetical protein